MLIKKWARDGGRVGEGPARKTPFKGVFLASPCTVVINLLCYSAYDIINSRMKVSFRAGFTIVETTLFLAISGLLLVMIMGSVGLSINTQRYQDAVQTLKITLQSQYAALASVQNERAKDLTCSLTSSSTLLVVNSDPASSPPGVGQSGCMVVGRLVRITGSPASAVQVYDVLAVRNSTSMPTAPRTDLELAGLLYAYNIGLTPVDSTTLEWRTSLGTPKQSAGIESTSAISDRALSLLFFRSPQSGQVYTFSSDKANGSIGGTTIRDMIRSTGSGQYGQKKRVICVDSAGLVSTGNRSIVIQASASSPGAIETSSNDLLKKEPSATGKVDQC